MRNGKREGSVRCTEKCLKGEKELYPFLELFNRPSPDRFNCAVERDSDREDRRKWKKITKKEDPLTCRNLR